MPAVTSRLEVIDAKVIDKDAAHRLDSRIRLLAGNVADNLTKLTNLITEAEAGQIHLTLGFKSWPAYLASALAKLNTWTTTDSRRELVNLLTDAGMSQRAIAQSVGVNQATVSRDQQVMHHASPDTARSPKLEQRRAWWQQQIAQAASVSDDEAAEIMAMADFDDDTFNSALAKARGEGDLSRQNIIKKCRERKLAPVIGLDGKTYTKPKRKPRPESQPPQKKQPPATFPQLMNHLTELNRLAAECADIADEVSFKTNATRRGLVYDTQQQCDSVLALTDGFQAVSHKLIDAVAKAARAAKTR